MGNLGIVGSESARGHYHDRRQTTLRILLNDLRIFLNNLRNNLRYWN